jgi:hypothetical protein
LSRLACRPTRARDATHLRDTRERFCHGVPGWSHPPVGRAQTRYDALRAVPTPLPAVTGAHGLASSDSRLSKTPPLSETPWITSSADPSVGHRSSSGATTKRGRDVRRHGPSGVRRRPGSFFPEIVAIGSRAESFLTRRAGRSSLSGRQRMGYRRRLPHLVGARSDESLRRRKRRDEKAVELFVRREDAERFPRGGPAGRGPDRRATSLSRSFSKGA